MSNHPIPSSSLITAAGLLAFVFAGSAGAAVPNLGVDAALSLAKASPDTACGSDDSRASTETPENLCRSGTSSAVSGNGPWTWTCSDGRHTSKCSANEGAHYTYRTVDYPGSSLTIIWGLDDFGHVSGEYQSGDTTSHAWTYRNGQFAALDPGGLFGGHFSAAGGPNDLGTLYGAYADASGLQHGFQVRWGNGETVDFAGHLNSNVDGINVFGAIAGVYWDSDGLYHGILRRNGRDIAVDAPGSRETYPLGIDSGGEIVGYWNTQPGVQRGFLRAANGRFSTIDVPLAGVTDTIVFAINDVGQVIGYYSDANGDLHGFIEQRGRFTYLDMPGAAFTIPTQINNFGVIAGEYYDADFKVHGFVATPW